MYWHYHNDNEGGRYWSNGRVWLHRSGGDRGQFLSSLCVEWTFPMSHCGWSVTFGGGDSGRNFGFTVAIPFLATFYVTFENVFPYGWFGWDFDRGHDRQIGCYFHDYAFWWQVWVGQMASYRRGASWCRWWRQGSVHFGRLLGRWVSEHYIERTEPVQIPMPEGVYHGTARIERWSRGRRFWFKKRTTEVWLEIPNGIPHAGKGENSWDCGDDGLFGIGGSSVEDAIGRAVADVLRARRRYGHASPEAIQKALA